MAAQTSPLRGKAYLTGDEYFRLQPDAWKLGTANCCGKTSAFPWTSIPMTSRRSWHIRFSIGDIPAMFQSAGPRLGLTVCGRWRGAGNQLLLSIGTGFKCNP